MSPSTAPPSPRAHRRMVVLLVVVAALAAACDPGAATSFDPTGPCTADGSAPGAYPDLEARVPERYEGRAPDLLDSGRNCTAENLGVLADAGIDEVRFAGGTWNFGSDIAAVLAVFRADGLTAGHLAEFYAASARAAGRTEVTGESELTIERRPAWRLDTKTGERIQSVVVWPAADPDVVNVVISHNMPDPKIEAAIASFGGT